MEKHSEMLIRSALHDLANVLAGVRGILELTQPEQPLNQRDRDRLEAVIEEGITTLERCRHLAMETLPEEHLEPGAVWRERLVETLVPVSTLFHCRIDISLEAAPGCDQWPGDRLRSYVQAVTRQVLPYARSGSLVLQCASAPEGWRFRWSPATVLPESLAPNPDGRPMDICCRWAARVGPSLGATLAIEAGSLLVTVPRG